MPTIAYESPALTEIGGFDELTMCTSVYSPCRDFLGCGNAIWCI